MTNNQLTREWLQGRIANMECYGVVGDEALILQVYRIALAAMDSEPVAWTDEEELRDANESGSGYLFGIARDANKFADPRRQIKLYRHAQPVPVVSADLLHAAASAIEDLFTTKDRTGAGVWFDLPFRLRSAANAQPAPVVPVEMNSDKAWGELKISAEDCQAWSEGWNACRAAMLQAEPVTTANKLGNSLVIPDDWKMVPVEPNGDMLAAAQDAYGETDGDIASTLCAAIAAASWEVK